MSKSEYRGVLISATWANTCSNPGGGTPSQIVAAGVVSPLAEVLSYQNKDVVARIAHEVGCTLDQAASIFDDVKRFLWMGGKNPGVSMIPTPIIDEGWHAFMLFSIDYAEFCERYFNGHIHHVPVRLDEPRKTNASLVPTIDTMHATFGGKPNHHWDYMSVRDALLQAA